jgi:hypothetical protein
MQNAVFYSFNYKQRTVHFLCVTPFCIPKETMSNTVPICIQQDATLHSLLYLETALHVLGGTSTHHQERMQLY